MCVRDSEKEKERERERDVSEKSLVFLFVLATEAVTPERSKNHLIIHFPT